MENVGAFTRRQREKKKKKAKKEEGYTHTPETRMAALVLGLKKRKATSKLVFSTSREKERYECFSFVLARHNSIASDNKISQWKDE
jgi:hypothetical protein